MHAHTEAHTFSTHHAASFRAFSFQNADKKKIVQRLSSLHNNQRGTSLQHPYDPTNAPVFMPHQLKISCKTRLCVQSQLSVLSSAFNKQSATTVHRAKKFSHTHTHTLPRTVLVALLGRAYPCDAAVPEMCKRAPHLLKGRKTKSLSI